MFCYLLLAVLLAAASAENYKYRITEEAHKRAVRFLKAEADRVAALPDVRSGGIPIAKIHPPGTLVYGTVVILHGFTGTGSDRAVQADALFEAGFNAYAVTLPGFAQTLEYWSSTTLREGYDAARSALLNDSRLPSVIQRLAPEDYLNFASATAKFAPLMPIVEDVIRAKLPPTTADNALRAFDLLQYSHLRIPPALCLP